MDRAAAATTTTTARSREVAAEPASGSSLEWNDSRVAQTQVAV